jgi:AraC-like DNA-binding protein
MKLRARLEDWLSLRLALFHIYEGPVQLLGRNTFVPPGGNHYVWFLEEGSVSVSQEDRVVQATKGQWLLASPGGRRQDFSEDARIISIHFQAKWPDGCNLFEEGLSLVLENSAYPSLEREACILLNAMKRTLPYDWAKIIKTPLTVKQYLTFQHLGLGFLIALVEALDQEGIIPSRIGQTDERLLAVLRQLDNHPINLPLDESKLSRNNGLSNDHLSVRFREAFGLTPNCYMESRRRDYARRLLAHSAMPIKEIASNLGFRTLSDFSAWFKRKHSQSPREFRKSAEPRYL